MRQTTVVGSRLLMAFLVDVNGKKTMGAESGRVLILFNSLQIDNSATRLTQRNHSCHFDPGERNAIKPARWIGSILDSLNNIWSTKKIEVAWNTSASQYQRWAPNSQLLCCCIDQFELVCNFNNFLGFGRVCKIQHRLQERNQLLM